MKRQFRSVVMLVAAGLIAAVQVTPKGLPQDSNKDDAILTLVQTWLNAESEGDSATLDKLIADDFLGTGPGGNILNKTDIVPPGGGERPKMPKSRLKESTVRVFGNTAVVMGSVAYETLPQPGFRFTLVFLNRGQGWQMIAAHLVNPPSAK
jgi:ketosteroid isomerase-like protein